MEKIILKKIYKRDNQGFSALDALWFRGERIEYLKPMILDKKLGSLITRITIPFGNSFLNTWRPERTGGFLSGLWLIWSYG